MPIRRILVPVEGSDQSGSVLEFGFSTALGLNAHLDALHVRADPKESVPFVGEGVSATMIEELIQLAAAEADSRAAKARAQFDACCKDSGIPVVVLAADAAEGPSAGWIEETGRDDDRVARLGRLSDMIITGRPTPDSSVSTQLVLNAALFETGRPVLVAPPGGAVGFGHRLAISWNGSAQASRAVAAAWPFLKKADEVTLLVADSENTALAETEELAQYLAWHGIGAKRQPVTATDKSVGAAVLATCREAGVDLLVMGAYTHSRMRQMILGGMTRHVLEHADIPLLMAH